MFAMVITTTTAVALYGTSTIIIYYMTYYASFSEWEVTLGFLTIGVVGIVCIPISDKIMQMFERKVSFAILMGISLLTFVIFYFIEPANKTGCYIGIAFWGFGWLCVWAIVYSVIADATVIEEYISGKQKEGTYYGIVQTGLKVGTGIFIWANGLVMDNAGYIANQVQSYTSLEAIKFMNSVVPFTIIVLSIITMFFYPINRQTYGTLLEAIDLRNNGEEYPEIKGLKIGDGKVRITGNTERGKASES